MTASPIFAHDANLGFPVDDAEWREFFARHGLQVVAYDDMAKLTVDLQAREHAFAYLPTANYFYLRDDAQYQPVANALYARDQTTQFSSVLVVTKASGITTLEQLRGKRLGYIHCYCTSSYFGPALFLREHDVTLADFFTLVPTAPFQGQIDALVAGQVDATMVQESVWLSKPENAAATRVIARQDGLPSPLVIVGADATDEFKQDLTQLLLSHRTKIGPTTLFSGFVEYQRQQVEEFFAASARALPYVA